MIHTKFLFVHFYVREGADKSLARPGRKQAVLLGKKRIKFRETDTSLLLEYEKTFDEGRKTLSFMHFTTEKLS